MTRIIAQASDYPFLQDNDGDHEFHKEFDNLFYELSLKVKHMVEQNPRLEAYLHGEITPAAIEATLKIVGYVEEPFMILLEVPVDMYHKFIVRERSDRPFYPDGYYFLETEEYDSFRTTFIGTDQLYETSKYVYFGSYSDKFHKIEVRGATNSAVRNQLDTLDS